MYKRLPATEKIRIIKKVHTGEKVTTICKEEGISRVVLYKWIKTYNSIGPRGKEKALTAKTAKGTSHWKTIGKDIERKVLKAALVTPSFSLKKLADTLNTTKILGSSSISAHGIWTILQKHDLNTINAREQYVSTNGNSLINPASHAAKSSMMGRIASGEKVSSICKEFKISRTTFYKWLKRYKSAQQSVSALHSQRAIGDKHWRFVPGLDALVTDIVIKNPEFTPQKLAQTLTLSQGRRVAGSHGIYNALKRLNLNTYEKRLAYARTVASIKEVQPQAGDWQLPATPRYSFSSSLSPPPPNGFFTSKKKLLFSSLVCIFGLLFFGLLAATIIQAPTIAGKIGMFFSVISLLMGTFFFLYSLKYYLTIALVLSFSRGEDSPGQEGKGTFWSRLFGFELSVEVEGEEKKPKKQGGMISNISNIQLERQPFISIHLSSYNEKRVIDRLLTAVTAMDYPNYEVVVADDSTDETIDLIRKWEEHPKVRISHRQSRDGYKGLALQKALELTDRRAEFVLVFDADFIPYPDTITQFLKYFQLTIGSLDREVIAQTPIAAVQGYQWHVLNKSENWITRGVRSEYSGSYVMERSGTEVYQGLKQISGSVYMIRREVLQSIGWGRSITEDLQFTLKLYEAGYKVVYTPYVQAPAEAVSTIKRLIRQRMRWAEGHSFNVKGMFWRLLAGRWEEGNNFKLEIGNSRKWVPSPLTISEKLEFLYLTPYYLQAAFFILGTFSWFLAEVVFQVRLPFWTEVWGWSLVFTNLFALPLMNAIGLFLEESDERDYMGLFSFVALTYIVAPFQAYAAVKGFLEKEEGPWFRTPKTGRITDTFVPNRFYRFVKGIFGRPAPGVSNAKFQLSNSQIPSSYLALATANNTFQNYRIPKRRMKWLGKCMIVILLISTMTLNYLAASVPTAYAFGSDITYSVASTTINATASGTAAGTSGTATLTVASTTGFVSSDEVMVIQMTGTGKGDFEEMVIQSVDSATQVTFTANKANTYTNDGSSKAQMVKAEINNNVIVSGGATVTAAAWNGTTGGVLYYIANSFTVNATGIVNMNGKGFAGGTNGGSGAGAISTAANGLNGTAGSAGSGDGGGGGGGGGNGGTSSVASGDNGGGGGGSGGGGAGGSYGTAASNGSAGAAGGKSGINNRAGGTAGTAGTAGLTYGCPDFSSTNGCMFLGSGGAGGGGSGGGGDGDSGNGGAGGAGATGGAGGGIIYVHANSIGNSGTIQANGAVGGNGAAGTGGSAGTTGTGGGGGAGGRGASAGGGSGGSIWLSASSVTVGTLTGTGGAAGTAGAGATGGPCDTGTANDGGGGGGGGSTGGGAGSINCTTAGTVGTGSGTVGSAGGSGRIKCDNSGANCSGGSPVIGNTEVATAPVPEYGIFGLPLLWFIPRLLAMLQMRLRRRLSFWGYLLLKEGRRMSRRRPRSQGKEVG